MLYKHIFCIMPVVSNSTCLHKKSLSLYQVLWIACIDMNNFNTVDIRTVLNFLNVIKTCRRCWIRRLYLYNNESWIFVVRYMWILMDTWVDHRITRNKTIWRSRFQYFWIISQGFHEMITLDSICLHPSGQWYLVYMWFSRVMATRVLSLDGFWLYWTLYDKYEILVLCVVHCIVVSKIFVQFTKVYDVYISVFGHLLVSNYG